MGVVLKMCVKRSFERRLKRLPKYGGKKTYTFKVEDCDNRIYIKIYYEGLLSQKDIDNLYRTLYNLFKKDRLTFLGIREYKDNKEICITYIRN